MTTEGPRLPTVELTAIGRVSSPLTALTDAPRQPDEGAPAAWLELDPALAPALAGVEVGDAVVVLTWLDRADRRTLAVHPRGDLDRPLLGVFATRSADRPNPVGLHTARVVAVEGTRVRLDHLEAVDGTPVLDLKPALGPVEER
ncbi:tRNA (N6-threonylcarbamoyladenosine(37)-N6)-methyltransferase TrmO [Luteimicrobium sp. NPDC057192]|uniref:tRNA (N6-threonylcarbamoyladenosine(37)-N6)-methyltransferase TrmO n=1 Tax=Luteimicrobium sp. NPDC057192 TaxID=3346042 RepID=UPI0036314C30